MSLQWMFLITKEEYYGQVEFVKELITLLHISSSISMLVFNEY